MATYPIPARVESENLEHRATTIDQHEPLPTRGLFTQGPAHSGRQSIERTPHVGGLGAQPDSTPRETVQHDPARRSRSTTPGPSSSSTSHAPGPDEVGDIRVCAGLVSSTNSASGWSSSTAAGVARSLRRHRSNGLSANRCAAQNLPRLRPARSNRSTSSRHCAAVRHARCLVPPARLMSPLASVSWGAASESDGTPDQNKASFGRLPRSSPSPRSRSSGSRVQGSFKRPTRTASATVFRISAPSRSSIDPLVRRLAFPALLVVHALEEDAVVLLGGHRLRRIADAPIGGAAVPVRRRGGPD